MNRALPFLERCLLHQSAFEQRGKARLWPYLAVVAIIIAGLVGYREWQQARWNRYFTALKQQSGIVVIGIEKHGSSYLVTGLKDPAVPDPSGKTWGIPVDARKVSFDLRPFLSLNTEFVKQRQIRSRKRVHREPDYSLRYRQFQAGPGRSGPY